MERVRVKVGRAWGRAGVRSGEGVVGKKDGNGVGREKK